MKLTPTAPLAAESLPLTLIHLDDWQCITVSGPDAESYLQGQLSADVPALTGNQHLLCGHCDAKGKLWSPLRLMRRGEGFTYLLRRSVAPLQLPELKKYAVFAKVSITPDDQAILLGVAGAQATQTLGRLFPQIPDADTPAVRAGNTILLYMAWPQPRYLLICDDTDEAQRITAQLATPAQTADSSQWLALDIEAGIPTIDEACCDLFLPQAVNLQALGGICFTKGCYSGQEMVTRATYRGANRRALFWLRGSAERLPHASEDLELHLGNGWRRSGSVLAAVRLADGSVYVQAVLNSDLAADSILRVRDDEQSQLTLCPLPYDITDNKD